MVGGVVARNCGQGVEEARGPMDADMEVNVLRPRAQRGRKEGGRISGWTDGAHLAQKIFES